MITSLTNHLVKHAKALHRRKEREDSGEMILEGMRLVEEAERAGASLRYVLHTSPRESRLESLLDSLRANGVACYEATSQVLETCSDTQTPQGIVAVCRQPALASLGELLALMSDASCGAHGKLRIVLALDGIQDPGNLGTIIRTCCAAGMLAVVGGAGCADAFSPKAVRSTMGAIFRIPIYMGELQSCLEGARTEGYKIVAACGEVGIPYYDVQLADKTVVIVGSEAVGISSHIREMADVQVNIPMAREVESLNAAIAAGIIVYEGARQAASIIL